MRLGRRYILYDALNGRRPPPRQRCDYLMCIETGYIGPPYYVLHQADFPWWPPQMMCLGRKVNQNFNAKALRVALS